MYKGAILGCGAVACQAHVPAWQTTSTFRIVAAVDPVPAHRAQLQSLLPTVRCYEDLATMLTHEQLDFLDICTPPVLHEEGILQACAHGLHVLCEKPLTFHAAAMQRIMTAATAAGVLVFPVHNWKYAPIVQTLKRLLQEETIGTPLALDLTTLRTQPAGDTGWRLDPAIAGGGILLDHGWHAFYLALFLLNAVPQTLMATTERRLYLAAEVEDTVTCEVTFPHAQARIHLTWAAAQRTNRVHVRGTRGAILVEDACLRVIQSGDMVQELHFPAALSAGSYHPDWFAAMLPDFHTALGTDSMRVQSLREAELCLRLTLLAYHSAAQGARSLSCTQALDCPVLSGPVAT
ncbi:MAG: Gfo/Idh/MocA family oxidoreductase [Candidatus Tectomicrobia bacterium]|uniref:Gfo/Idh/MocA family oxidoreductase n=1 Tax=Tectimicrobiota bacterium TaxID=2528274 RepID=A0A938B5D6_UNCTE|nr:Gfo/Idh/MocA family oxidoreductase [Candidatus Tectomicrobia bacterium]